MRALLCGLFSLVLISGTTLFSPIQTLADPGDNNGNHFGQINNGNNGNGSSYQGAVPIPDTLALFGVGFAGLVAWQVLSRRKLS
jgi:hypothetical protein